MLRILCSLALLVSLVTHAFGENIAECGASAGYGFYPKAGLAASQPDIGKWVPDTISGGRFSLSENQGEFDLLVLDAKGSVYSSKQDGASVIVVGSSDKSLSALVSYPNHYVETYTFLRNEDGQAEALWTSNKWGHRSRR